MNLLTLICLSLAVLSSDALNGLRTMYCSPGMPQPTIRISGCSQQPCNIRKGVALPFEVDFIFNSPPSQSTDFQFSATIPYYAVPPNAYLSVLARGDCATNGNIGFTCPVRAGSRYTMKNQLYLDPRAVCTAGCDGLGPGGTGLRSTQWSLGVYGSDESYSGCSFDIDLNITL